MHDAIVFVSSSCTDHAHLSRWVFPPAHQSTPTTASIFLRIAREALKWMDSTTIVNVYPHSTKDFRQADQDLQPLNKFRDEWSRKGLVGPGLDFEKIAIIGIPAPAPSLKIRQISNTTRQLRASSSSFFKTDLSTPPSRSFISSSMAGSHSN